MNILTKIILFLLISSTCFSQKTYWASKVEAFSSEYQDTKTTQEFRAVQVLGRPNRLPQIGESTCAWQPLILDNPVDDYIIVAFDTIMPIRQVAVAENFGQGCITKIIAFDKFNNQHIIYENKSEATPQVQIGKMFNLILEQMSEYSVRAIKVILNTNRVKGKNQIDAIGISQSQTPIHATV